MIKPPIISSNVSLLQATRVLASLPILQLWIFSQVLDITSRSTRFSLAGHCHCLARLAHISTEPTFTCITTPKDKRTFKMDGAESDFDPNASPLETSASLSEAVCSTPDTEVSIPDIVPSKQNDQTARVWATAKVAELTQEEKVRSGAAIEHWTLLTASRFPCSQLRIFGGPRPSLRKASRQQRQVTDLMAHEEASSSVVQR